jgi:hypothetical protein
MRDGGPLITCEDSGLHSTMQHRKSEVIREVPECATVGCTAPIMSIALHVTSLHNHPGHAHRAIDGCEGRFESLGTIEDFRHTIAAICSNREPMLSILSGRRATISAADEHA